MTRLASILIYSAASCYVVAEVAYYDETRCVYTLSMQSPFGVFVPLSDVLSKGVSSSGVEEPPMIGEGDYEALDRLKVKRHAQARRTHFCSRASRRLIVGHTFETDITDDERKEECLCGIYNRSCA